MKLSWFSLELTKSTQFLTQIVSHPVLWHLIELRLTLVALLGCALSPHRHRDKSLMSLHLCLRPMHVGSELKNKGFDLGDSGAVIGTESAFKIGARRAWRSARKPVLALSITHYHNPSLVLLRCHYPSPPQLVWYLLYHPTLPHPLSWSLQESAEAVELSLSDVDVSISGSLLWYLCIS